MSKGKGQQVMEHSLYALEFKLPDRKGILQTVQRCYQLKFNHFANIICSIHVVSVTTDIMREISF